MSRIIKNIILHCTAGPQTQKIEDIQAYWRTKLGWSRPGYHFIFKPNGECVQLLPISEISNGVAGFNKNAINLSYIGGVENGKPVDNRTKAQRVEMEIKVRELHETFPNAKISGHRDFSPDKNRDGIIQPGEWIKACPSFSVSEWLREIGLVPNATPFVVKRMVRSKTGSPVNIRKGPGVEFDVVGKPIPSGTPAIIVSKNANETWTQVIVNDDVSGWIRSDFIQ